MIEEFKQLAPLVLGGGGGAVILLAMVLSYYGKWMWTSAHDREMALMRETLARSDQRAEEWKTLALRDRPLAERAVQVAGAAVGRLDGGTQ